MKWRGALIIIMLSAARWRSAFFLLCSRVGRHIPLALLSGLFPAAGGFCPPLPHCPGFLCSLAPTMAFFLPLNIYVHFLPLCVLFVLFCCLLCFSFLLLQNWEIAQAHTHKPELICSSSLWFRPLSLNLSSLHFSLFLLPIVPPIIHCDTHTYTHVDNKPGCDFRWWKHNHPLTVDLDFSNDLRQVLNYCHEVDPEIHTSDTRDPPCRGFCPYVYSDSDSDWTHQSYTFCKWDGF